MFFWKMQGAGNDFIILDGRKEQMPRDMSALARRLCRRHLSIGADGIMLILPPEKGGHCGVKVINADGSEAEMCGNGVRCVARYAWEEGIPGDDILIESKAGLVEARRLSKRQYRVKLNAPSVIKENQTLEAGGKTWQYTCIELGDPGIPHIVLPYPGLREADREALRHLGRELRYHPAFRKGTNVNFYDLCDPAEADFSLLTYERGVEDFTLACGTGSGSTALALRLAGKAGDRVRLAMGGGILQVELKPAGEGYEIFLIGDTNIVAKGEVWDEDLE
jgi:diaminopimelate epimerase